jgi:DNA-binding transcriptional LysR family regulator
VASAGQSWRSRIAAHLAGRLVLDYARPLLRKAQALKQELDRFSVEESGTLSFGCNSARDMPAELAAHQTHFGVITLREQGLSPLAKAFIEIIQKLDGQGTRRLLAITEFGSDLF